MMSHSRVWPDSQSAVPDSDDILSPTLKPPSDDATVLGALIFFFVVFCSELKKFLNENVRWQKGSCNVKHPSTVTCINLLSLNLFTESVTPGVSGGTIPWLITNRVKTKPSMYKPPLVQTDFITPTKRIRLGLGFSLLLILDTARTNLPPQNINTHKSIHKTTEPQMTAMIPKKTINCWLPKATAPSNGKKHSI